MLDIKRIRQNPGELKAALAKRCKSDADVDGLLELDRERRELIALTEAMKKRKNEVSALVPQLKKRGEDASALFAEMKELGASLKAQEDRLRLVAEEFNDAMLSLPNIPHESVQPGPDESANLEVRRVGQPRQFEFEPKAHWDIGTALGILDFETAAKVTGARFTFYKGLGAKLERAIAAFFLNTHTDNGYVEVAPPLMVNAASATGTGQLPKFGDGMFHVENTDYYLIPTAEVPVTNMYRDVILDEKDLPIWHCAFSPCFRSEAGSAGRDTRGLIRQHQFNKVELVKFTTPQTSYEEHEKLVGDAERVLRLLGLPYRVVLLCAGDMSASAAKCYDLEVWMPSYGRYVEISSCSNFEDYQARRANIKYRGEKGVEYVHTLNGSGLAVGRTTAAILENYQRADGSVAVPQALRAFMGRDTLA